MPDTRVTVAPEGTKAELEKIEREIEGLVKGCKEGIDERLLIVHDRRLYLHTNRSFDQYLRDRWNIGKSRGYQILIAENIRKQIADERPRAPLPNRSQAAALAKAPAGERAKAWSDAQDHAKKNGTPVTAVTVQRVVGAPKKADEKPWDQYEMDVEEITALLRAVGKKMNAAFKADADSKRLNERYAHFLTHSGTIGAVNAIIRNIETNMPAKETDKPPGFLPVRVVKMRASR